MSSEHVGPANAGYDPKFRRMTLDSGTLCYLNLGPTTGTMTDLPLTFVYKVHPKAVEIEVNHSCISVKFCVDAGPSLNSCPLGNVHPSIHPSS